MYCVLYLESLFHCTYLLFYKLVSYPLLNMEFVVVVCIVLVFGCKSPVAYILDIAFTGITGYNS